MTSPTDDPSGLCDGFVQSKNGFVQSKAAAETKYDSPPLPAALDCRGIGRLLRRARTPPASNSPMLWQTSHDRTVQVRNRVLINNIKQLVEFSPRADHVGLTTG